MLLNKVCWHDAEIPISERMQPEFVRIISDFTSKMETRGQSSDYYKQNRNASFPKKDIQIGKYGEFAATLFLHREKKFPILMPDFEVRHGITKGWDCDLPFSSKNSQYPNCHVKTCDQSASEFVSRCRGDKYTWTFQFGNATGTGGRDALFDNIDSKELILFMFVPEFGAKTVRLIASAPWNEVYEILSDPIAKKFKGLKKCVYSDDLKKLANQQTI